MRFFRFFVLGGPLLSSCAKPQEPLEELGPLSFRGAAVEGDFEGVVDAIEAQIPHLKGLIDLGQALPHLALMPRFITKSRIWGSCFRPSYPLFCSHERTLWSTNGPLALS